ncbi:hypothetical protein LN042_15015 [Kitasatospora sp. RB6PN24]|uniref:hypothetical protein n=1 Tax=Kitasatospora humi TaxID=2893891 RepID=UPI001E30618D|nr:hypothetical protein [Kitasatospora humi]MCC9308385.1 hypothetical protein [Kitasatospora humi]
MTTVAEFLALSSALTGLGPAQLRGTGMVGAYRSLVVQQAGAEALDRLVATVARGGTDPSAFADRPERELAEAIAQLWRLGSWPGLGTADRPYLLPGKA